MKLSISPNLTLPPDAATQTFAFIGRKGSGKTFAAGKLAECLLDAGVQTVILDAVGNWFGLRLSADGKATGYDIPVLGGLRGDIPLEATGGHLIADILTETGRSLIIDISQFSKADRQRFATAFAERLWRNKKAERHPSPVHLIIEESQLIVPESVRGDSAQMVGIYEEIIRLGRNYGIGVSMISQRPQSVNKEVLNQTECLFAFQVNGKHERVALRDWVVYHGAEKSLVDELPSLPVGTAYVWSPQWLRILEKVQIGRKRTFDASATPKVGGAQIRRDLKPLDLDDLKTRMASTIEKAKADDPRELRRRITELERQVKSPQQPKPEMQIREVPVITTEMLSELRATALRLSQTLETVSEQLRRLEPTTVPTRSQPVPPPAPRASGFRVPAKPVSAPARNPQSAINLRKGERKILQMFAARYPIKLTKVQVATLSGFTASGGTFQQYFGTLKREGLIEVVGNEVTISESGMAYLGTDIPQQAETTEELLAMWDQSLREGERVILHYLVEIHPRSITKQELGDVTGYAASGGTFQQYLGTLKRNNLVEVHRGEVVASDTLFLTQKGTRS